VGFYKGLKLMPDVLEKILLILLRYSLLKSNKEHSNPIRKEKEEK
jgi:hypothetical protein